MKKYLKFILIALQSLIIFILIWGNTVTIIKHIETNVIIDNFKSKAILDEDLSTKTQKLYKIESNEELSSYITYNNKIIPGNVGDVIVSPQSTMYVAGNDFLDSLLTGFITFYAGGHAAIATGNYGSYDVGNANNLMNVESTGMGEDDNPAILSDRFSWVNRMETEVIVLRAKTSVEKRRELVSMATSFIGDPYNYSFIFNTTDTSYCSDLVAKCYQKIGINLNKDSFATTIYDIIVSGDVYVSYYHYFDGDGIKHIYYLG